MFKKNILELIKDLRLEASVSQEDLANYIWLSRLTYINRENWKSLFKLEELEKIADFFEKPLNYFLEKQNKIDENRKLKDLILYILHNFKSKENLWKTTLNKLLYFSDFNYYEWTWGFITDSIYKKLPYWPVPENIRIILDEMLKDWEIIITEEKKYDYSTQRIIAIKKVDENFFKEIDSKNKEKRDNYTPYSDLPSSKQIVLDVLKKYENWTAKSLSELSHEDTPYKATKNLWDIIRPEYVFYRSKAFIVNHHNL